MAAALTARIEQASVRAVEEELGRLAAEAAPGRTLLRTRVLTHLAWVPSAWEAAAREALAGLGERHPSRTILLFPDPDAGRDGLDAEVDLRLFPAGEGDRAVCSEVVAIWLRGAAARAPASVVQPLLVSDLPAFLRWRGQLPFGAPELSQLLDVVDRLVVDSREWPEPAVFFPSLCSLFAVVAVSDLAWARLEPWRLALATLWPRVATATRLAVRGPAAESLLLHGWLTARLGRPVALEREPAVEVERVEIDGLEARPERPERPTPSELLSAQLELFGPDPIYEEAVRAASSLRERAA